MNNHSCRVSVIVPVYNGEKFIESAVRNVLGQSYGPSELIVVDDGSTDRTAELLKAFQGVIRYVHQGKSGPAAARNHGLKLAVGNIVAFLDADDLWPDTKLETHVRFLKENPDVDIVQGLIQQMILNKSNPSSSDMRFDLSSAPYQFINIGSATYRKSVFDRIGDFDEMLFDNEDTDWFIRAWEKNVKKVLINEVSLYYRLHDGNMVWHQKPAKRALLKIFKKHLDRMRREKAGVDSNLSDLRNYIGQPPVLRRLHHEQY